MVLVVLVSIIAVIWFISQSLTELKRESFQRGQESVESQIKRIQCRAVEGSERIAQYDPELLKRILERSIGTVNSPPVTTIYVTTPSHRSIDAKPFVLLWLQKEICRLKNCEEIPQHISDSVWGEWEEYRKAAFGSLGEAEISRRVSLKQMALDFAEANPTVIEKRDNVMSAVSEIFHTLLEYQFVQIHEAVVPVRTIVKHGFVSGNIDIGYAPADYSIVPYRCLRVLLGPAVYAPFADLWQRQAGILSSWEEYNSMQKHLYG